MNAVSDSSNNFMEENGGGSDSDSNSDDSPEYYQPISATADDASDSDDVDSQFHRLPNGYSNGVANGVSSLDLSDEDDDDEETKRREEEEREREEAAMRESERRRAAPLGAENVNRVVEAMRGVRFSGAAPVWASRVPEEQWIDQIRRSREETQATRHV